MALEVQTLKREFKFSKNGTTVTLPDPNPQFTVNDVVKFYAGQYPELTNGLLEGPKIESDKAVYTVTTKAGKLG